MTPESEVAAQAATPPLVKETKSAKAAKAPAKPKAAKKTATRKTVEKVIRLAKRANKCKAGDVGYHACKCGGPLCGANVTE